MPSPSRLCLLSVLVLLLPAAVAAQMRVETDAAELAARIEGARRGLAGAQPRDAEHLARRVIAQLRLGDAAAAAAALGADLAPERHDVRWELAMHAAYARATGDHTRAAQRLASFAQRLDALEHGPPASGYADGALRVHARYCLALLTASCGGTDAAAQATTHERRATMALLLLEQDTWQPGLGLFRPTPRRGELAMPEPADASVLLPCSVGMVVASGDRMLRHLATVLDAAAAGDSLRWQPRGATNDHAALFLAAATTLGDADRRARAWRSPWPDAQDDPIALAMHVDARLFAVTGMRIAVGGGSAPDWLRLAPWLPPDTSRLRLDGMLANGRRLDLELAASGPQIRVRVRLDDPLGLGPLQTVVAGSTQQVVTRLLPGEPFECLVPLR